MALAVERLQSIIDRVERIDAERKALGDDRKDVLSEAESAGFDRKVIVDMIRRRKLERAELEEHETLLDLYERELARSSTDNNDL